VVVSVFAVWIVSPRFAIDGHSLVDDWSAISRSPDQLEALTRLENPEAERFRRALSVGIPRTLPRR